jgi:hypothetical protein
VGARHALQERVTKPLSVTSGIEAAHGRVNRSIAAIRQQLGVDGSVWPNAMENELQELEAAVSGLVDTALMALCMIQDEKVSANGLVRQIRQLIESSGR